MADRVELEVEEMAFGGAAVGRLASGKVVFVHGAADQERVRAAIFRSKKSFSEAVVTDVLEPSVSRIEPICSLAGRCGGCSWMHLRLEAQRRWKRRLLVQELARAGVDDAEERVEAIRGGDGLGERTRCRLHVAGGQIGFREARSRRVVAFEGCLALDPTLEAFASDVAEAFSGWRVRPAELELTVDVEGRRGLWVGLEGDGDLPRWIELARSVGVETMRSSLGRRAGRRSQFGGVLKEKTGELEIDYEPGLFIQSNRAINRLLVGAALEGDLAGRRFVELYAGVGNFTVHLVRLFEEGLAIEGSRAAASLLEGNLSGRATRVEVAAESDRRSAERLLSMPKSDLLFADPPRAGMKALESVFETNPPEAVVLVSCHAMAAVRDVGHLIRRCGYRLVRVIPVDMFPQTHHLELVAFLGPPQE